MGGVGKRGACVRANPGTTRDLHWNGRGVHRRGCAGGAVSGIGKIRWNRTAPDRVQYVTAPKGEGPQPRARGAPAPTT